jgi:hypothetical protein
LSFVLLSGTVKAQISFDPAVNYAVGVEPSGVTVADFDGGGGPDIAVTSDTPDKVSILSNSGSGAFGAPVAVALGGGDSPHGVAAANFDGDSDIDLVVVLKNIDAVQLLTNNAGSFTAGAVTAVNGLLPRDVVVGDLDKNGSPDVVTSNRDSDNVSVLLNNAGVLAGGVTYPAGLEPRGLALGHFNNDTFLDLAIAAHDSRQVSVLLNDGDGIFAAPIKLSLGPDLRPVGVVAADFDVDGLLDLATADQDSAQVSILRNLGNTNFGAAVEVAVGMTPGPLTSADLDGNASGDLVSANRDSNNVSVLINRNSGVMFDDGFESGDTSAWSSTTP